MSALDCAPRPAAISRESAPLARSAGPARGRVVIALVALAAIGLHLCLRYGFHVGSIGPVKVSDLPLWVALLAGGGPLVLDLITKALRGEFGSDLLAGLSIVTSVILGEYLAGTVVVLMLSGGEALEAFAVRRAASALA